MRAVAAHEVHARGGSNHRVDSRMTKRWKGGDLVAEGAGAQQIWLNSSLISGRRSK